MLPAGSGGYQGYLGPGDEEDWYEIAVEENRGLLVVMTPSEGNFDLVVTYPGGEQASNQLGTSSDGAFITPS